MTIDKSKYHFILIDDSKIDLFLAEKIIQNAFPGCEIIQFDKPEEGLHFIKAANHTTNYIVLLDIQMPVITGFELLTEFATLEENIKSHFKFIILTSSNNATDLNRGRTNKYVTNVLVKPLNIDSLVNSLPY